MAPCNNPFVKVVLHALADKVANGVLAGLLEFPANGPDFLEELFPGRLDGDDDFVRLLAHRPVEPGSRR